MLLTHLRAQQYLVNINKSVEDQLPRPRPLPVQQLSSVKETLQPSVEEVGPLTKLMEALGFTGPLKYSKWVSLGGLLPGQL